MTSFLCHDDGLHESHAHATVALQTGFKIGDCVKVQDLMSAAGQQLNGCHGSIVMLSADTDRVGVHIDGVGSKLLKPAKLVPVTQIAHLACQHEDQAAGAGCSGMLEGLSAQIKVGDRVYLKGLVSQVGQQLNGCKGTVLSYDDLAERFGVEVDDVGRKSLKASNLSPVMQAGIHATYFGDEDVNRPESEAHVEDIDLEDVVTQSVIENSLRCSEAAQPFQQWQDTNAQISDAVLRSRVLAEAQKVVLLTFSRSPKQYREALMTAPELSDYRRALEDAGFAVEHKSGAKMMVQPQQYAALIETISWSRLSLAPRHVFLDPSIEHVVINVLEAVSQTLPKKQKFYIQSTLNVPLDLAVQALKKESGVLVRRTFVEISIPSSMYSASSSGPCTLSTTDADSRKGANPRLNSSLRS